MNDQPLRRQRALGMGEANPVHPRPKSGLARQGKDVRPRAETAHLAGVDDAPPNVDYLEARRKIVGQGEDQRGRPDRRVWAEAGQAQGERRHALRLSPRLPG
jgi:hypothetical protein